MRIVVFGAGGVGGVIGGRLAQHADRHGHDITLVARGAHLEAMQRHGVRIIAPDGEVVVPVDAVGRIDEVPLAPGDVVVLAMKTQDSPSALDALVSHAPAGITVACAQNGVENERLAARLFEHVLGVCVMLPASIPEPGVVECNGEPFNAILDLGCYPYGTDERAGALAAAFEAAGLASQVDARIMRHKYRKLVMNLANSIDAVVDHPAGAAPLIERAVAEAEACYAAAGIECTTHEDEQARRKGRLKVVPVAGRPRGGGSTWQSLARGATSTEVDWLNGEIALLGRLHSVPTPVNALLQAIAREAIEQRAAPRSMPVADLLARAEALPRIPVE